MDIKTRFATLAKATHLDVLLPKIDIEVEALLRDGKLEQIFQAPTRRNLFFDELADVLVVLRTSISETELRTILPHLELVIAAHATDAVPQGSGNTASASGKHDINSSSFQGTSYTDIVTHDEKIYLIWRPVLHLLRPRARLQRPAIYFTANLSLTSTSNHEYLDQERKGFLKSFEPMPANVLEPLRFDPAFGSSNIFLPESRITKVAPKAHNLCDAVRPIRGASKRAFPAVPALFSKVKFSTLPDAVVASLHLETSPVIAGDVTIDSVKIDPSHAQVNALTGEDLPMDTRAGDETILLYRIQKEIEDFRTREDATLSISIAAHASLETGAEVAFDVSMQTHLDFDRTMPKHVYRWSRPLSTSSGHHRGLSTQSNPSVIHQIPRSGSGLEPGVVFNFSAEATTQHGSEFKIDVLCINHTGRQRRFALLMLQPRKPRLQSSATSSEADTVANIFNRPPLERPKPSDVLELSPDVRIGPLLPDARFETHLRFQALQTGVLDLGVLRIHDIDTRQIFDIKELPDVIALAKE